MVELDGQLADVVAVDVLVVTRRRLAQADLDPLLVLPVHLVLLRADDGHTGDAAVEGQQDGILRDDRAGGDAGVVVEDAVAATGLRDGRGCQVAGAALGLRLHGRLGRDLLVGAGRVRALTATGGERTQQ